LKVNTLYKERYVYFYPLATGVWNPSV